MSTGEPSDSQTRAPERRRIQSVAVGFRLIRALEAASAPMSLTQLAAAADMPTSQAHLYLASYLHEGLVHQDPGTNRYQLGPFALRLGVAAMRALDVVALAREELDRLRERTGESAHFSVWSDRGPCPSPRAWASFCRCCRPPPAGPFWPISAKGTPPPCWRWK